MKAILLALVVLLSGCADAELGDECVEAEDCEGLPGEAACYINPAAGSADDGYCTMLCDEDGTSAIDPELRLTCEDLGGMCDGQLITRGETRAFCRK